MSLASLTLIYWLDRLKRDEIIPQRGKETGMASVTLIALTAAASERDGNSGDRGRGTASFSFLRSRDLTNFSAKSFKNQVIGGCLAFIQK